MPLDRTTTAGPNKINNHGSRAGSFQYYIVVAAGSAVAVAALTAIMLLMIYVTIHVRNKKLKFSSKVVQQISRQRQRSRNSNIHIEETPSAEVSKLPESEVDLTPVESSSLEPPILPPLSESDTDCEIVQEADQDRSLPTQIPVYIFLGPRENDPPIPKSPIIECKQNLAYPHLGPEDNSTAASLQRKPITCKQNAAYIHLDPEDA